jgi:hypothetical protein
VSLEWNSSIKSKQLVQQQSSQRRRRNEKIIIGQSVESFSNDVSVGGKVKLACSIGSNLPPSHQRLLLELPSHHEKILVAFLTSSLASFPSLFG